MAYAYNTPHDPSVIRRELQVLKERRGRAAGRHVPEIVLQKVLGDSCGDAETGSEASASGASVSSLYALASRVEELWRRERRQHEVNTERNEQLKNERRQGSFNTCRSSASSSAGRGVAGDDNGDDVITVKPRRYARAQPCHSLSNNNSRGSIANDQGNDGNGIKVPTRPRSVARERQAAGDLGDLFNVNTDGLGSFKY